MNSSRASENDGSALACSPERAANLLRRNHAASATARHSGERRCRAAGRCRASRSPRATRRLRARRPCARCLPLRRDLHEEVLDQQRDVLAAVAQRRQLQCARRSADSRGPRGTRPGSSSPSRSWCVAEITRTFDLDRLGAADGPHLAPLAARAAASPAAASACRRSRRAAAFRRRRPGTGPCASRSRR